VTITDKEIIEMAKVDAKMVFDDKLFVDAENWNIDGWIRVVSMPLFKYFDNLSEAQQELYKYISTVELNKLYFQSLMDSGEEIDPFYFDLDLWYRISIMPLDFSDIETFAKAIIDNPKYITKGAYKETNMQELIRIYSLYEIELFPLDWTRQFGIEFALYLFN